MSNVLSEEKKQQVIALGKLGWPLRRIEKATGVRRETAGAYLKAAGITVDRPGRRSSAKPAIRVATDSEDSKPANDAGVTTDFIRPFSEKPPIQLPAPKLSTSDCEPFRETIELGLSRGRNAMAIWQDMVTDHGFSGAYNTVKRFVGKLRGSKQPEAVGIILTGPGEESQVDYGTGPMVRDPQTGKYRRTRLFVMTLGYSRKAVRLLVFRSSTRTWAELHETAFRRLGDTRIHGTTKRQVAAMFAEEKSFLLPLPLEPFRYYQYGERTVHLDGCVEVDAAYYSVPPGWIGKLVHVQSDSLHVRILNPKTHQLL